MLTSARVSSENSDLWHYDAEATKKVLSLTIPQPLIDQVSFKLRSTTDPTADCRNTGWP